MMTLREILMQRDLYDLLMLADRYMIAPPDTLSSEDWQLIMDFAKTNDSDRIEYYLELAEEKDEHTWTVDPDEFEDEESYIAVRNFREKEYRIVCSLEKADQAGPYLCGQIAGCLLRPDTMKALLSSAGDGTVSLLGYLYEVSAENREQDAAYHPDPYAVSWRAAGTLQAWGYAVVSPAPAVMYEDRRRRVDTIRISSDVLALFHELYTSELDIRRRTNNLIFDICYMAREYYITPPLDIVLEMYRTAAKSQPDLPDPDEECFIRTAKEVSEGLYTIWSYRGTYYLMEESFVDEISEAEEPFTENSEDMAETMLGLNLQTMQQLDYDFYIPGEAEMLDFCSSGWWKKREAYRKLEDWLQGYYDEQNNLNSIFSRMVANISEDENFGNSRYWGDDTDQEISETINKAMWLFMSGYETEAVYSELENITAWINEQAEEELKQILEKCRRQTNQTDLLGHFPVYEKVVFREIRPDETEQAIEIEQICFPPNEACSPQMMRERIKAAAPLFLVAVDRESGRLAGFLNGICTDEQAFRDEFFTDASLHNPDGKNVMLCGLDVLPDWRHQELARELVHAFCRKEKANGRKRLILTCLDDKVQMYEKLGFTDRGLSASSWGGEQWHEMDLTLTDSP